MSRRLLEPPEHIRDAMLTVISPRNSWVPGHPNQPMKSEPTNKNAIIFRKLCPKLDPNDALLIEEFVEFAESEDCSG